MFKYLSTKRLLVLGLVILAAMLVLPGGALSQVTPPSSASAEGWIGSVTSAIITKMVGMVDTLEKAMLAVGANDRFKAFGKYLIAVLGTTVIIWNILKNMVLKSNVTQIVADLVFPVVVIALAIMALDKNFAGMINQSVKSLAVALNPGVPASAKGFALAMLNVIDKAWSSTPQLTLMNLLGGMLGQLLLQLITMIFLFVALAIGVVMILVAQFQVSFAIVMAPVLIPWLLFKPTEFIFAGWLTYLLKASFAFVTIAMIASFGMSFVEGLNSAMMPGGKPPEGIEGIVTYACLASGCLLVAFLMYKADDIGSGIISGNTAGINGIGRVAAGGAAPVLKGAASMAGGAAKAGGAAALGAAHRGKSDAQLTSLAKSMQPRQGTAARKLYEAVANRPNSAGGSGGRGTWSDAGSGS